MVILNGFQTRENFYAFLCNQKGFSCKIIPEIPQHTIIAAAKSL